MKSHACVAIPCATMVEHDSLPFDFNRAHEHWVSRVEIARRHLHAGDILLLAEEAPTIVLRIEGLLAAGNTLLELHRYDFALEQFDTILSLRPDHQTARQQRIACLVHLGRLDEARATAPDIAVRELALDTPSFVPRNVFLFSGHMIDAPGRSTPRFPPHKEAAAAQRIAATLDALGAGPGDLALTQGASGGDILFLEACAARGVRLHLMLPLAEPEFIEQSLLAASRGGEWLKRYLHLKAGLTDAPRILPLELGPPSWSGGAGADNPFERCNRWLLNTAFAWGIDKLQFICLWDGGGGDGPGGTAHMYREVERRTGKVSWIDTRTL